MQHPGVRSGFGNNSLGEVFARGLNCLRVHRRFVNISQELGHVGYVPMAQVWLRRLLSFAGGLIAQFFHLPVLPKRSDREGRWGNWKTTTFLFCH